MYTAASIGDKYEGELDHNEIAVDIVNDIAPDGGLVILSDGETKTITSGEIVHIR